MSKMIKGKWTACAFCAIVLCFGFAIAGCSSGVSSSAAASSASSAASASASASASSSTAADSTATSSEASIAVPEEMVNLTETARNTVKDNDTAAADQFDSLPTTEVEGFDVVNSDTVEEGLEDASKAPGDATLLMNGGIQLLVPQNWVFSSTADGFMFQSANGTITGSMDAFPKAPGEVLDVELIAHSLPCYALDNGYSNVEIIGYETKYSERGTLVSAAVAWRGTYKGVSMIVYDQVIESASYLNWIEIGGSDENVLASADVIDAIVESISFNSGEQI